MIFYPPDNLIRYKSIDLHTGGEPVRVLDSAIQDLPEMSILEYRRVFEKEYDHIRKALIFEPRGHADMYGCIIVPSSKADFGVLFIHNDGYSTMCGHATIALGKLAVEAGWISSEGSTSRFTLEAPCGVLEVEVELNENKGVATKFLNVPSYVVDLDETILVDGIGEVKYDLAYGGAYYAFVNADELGIAMTSENAGELIKLGRLIKKEINDRIDIEHPYEADLGFLYGIIFTGEPHSNSADSRNVCIFADGELDRSPTGSGVSARVAINHKRGILNQQDIFTVESILGSEFQCGIHDLVKFGKYDAVIPWVKGKSYFTGRHEFWVDPNDPLREGFLLR